MIWCNVHHSTFKTPTSRWCKKSNPHDVCEVDKSTLPPRQLPMKALFLLGSRADRPGWLSFLQHAQREGYVLDHPTDHDLTDEEWEDMAEMRLTVLVRAFDTFMARVNVNE